MFSYEFFYEVKQRKPSGEFLLHSELFCRFLHTYELWRWQLFRSILTVITYFCVILLVVLVIAGYYKVDIDSKLAALLNTSLGLRFGQVRHSKDCNTVWQIEGIFLIYLSFVAVCLTVVGNIKSVILHSLGLSNSVLYNKIRLRCLGHTLKGKKYSTNTYLFRAMASLDRSNTATILKLQLVCHRNDYCTVWIDPFFLFISSSVAVCDWLLQGISKQIFWHFHLDF